MKFVAVLAALLSSALTAAATDMPGFEGYFGFDWVKFNPDTHNIRSFTADGGSAQLVYNFHKGIGLAFDAGAVTKDTFGGVLNNRQTHFLLGPRYGFHNHSRFTPFGEILFGGAEASVSTSIVEAPTVFPEGPTVSPLTSITLPDNVSARLTASRTSFAMMTGGGLDIKLAKHFTYRLFDADYFLTRPISFISGENVNKNNFRVTTGVALTWGEAR
jgi:opacity protein-like surface antigen